MLYRKLYILILVVFQLFACHKVKKETTINGVVVDKTTLNPIPFATVSFTVTHDQGLYPYNIEHPAVKADFKGRFNIKDEDPIMIFEVSKNGYLPQFYSSAFPTIIQGEVNDVELRMSPKDGVLKLNIQNNTNFPDTIYIGIHSPTFEQEHAGAQGVISKHTLGVGGMSTLIHLVNLTSEDSIGVYWGFTSLPYEIKILPFHEFVSVSRNDTTTFNLSF